MERPRKTERRKHNPTRDEKKAVVQSENSSLSSLGSLPEAKSVVLHFNNDHGSQRRITTHLGGSSSHASVRMTEESKKHTGESKSHETGSRSCPHCRKLFANAFAVPKHISVSLSDYITGTIYH